MSTINIRSQIHFFEDKPFNNKSVYIRYGWCPSIVLWTQNVNWFLHLCDLETRTKFDTLESLLPIRLRLPQVMIQFLVYDQAKGQGAVS